MGRDAGYHDQSLNPERIVRSPMSGTPRRRHAAWVVALLAVSLAGCEGTFTSDLASDPPADATIAQVNANLLGVELQKADGTTENVEFTSSEAVDLLSFVDGTPMRLFTSEPLPAGDYTGIRLLFDTSTDANVVDTVGGEKTVTLGDGPFASVDFTVTDNRRSLAEFTLSLDLRQSLELDAAGDAYTLTPVARAVVTTDAATISGAVASSACSSSTTLATDAAVYLFRERDVTPDDLDGADAEPYATTNVVSDGSADGFQYSLRFLAPGAYTLALTCQGNLDAPGTNDDITFVDTQNVSVDSAATAEVDLD